jgi:hypothetical protein
VRDPKQEGTLGALASETRQRPPDGDGDLLKEIFAFAEIARVAARESR